MGTTLSLIVSDGSLSGDADAVTISVSEAPFTNTPSIANAGSDQSVEQGSTVQLSAAYSSDADDDSLSYL